MPCFPLRWWNSPVSGEGWTTRKKKRTWYFHFFSLDNSLRQKSLEYCVGGGRSAWENQTRMSAGQRKQQRTNFQKKQNAFKTNKKQDQYLKKREKWVFSFELAECHRPVVYFSFFQFYFSFILISLKRSVENWRRKKQLFRLSIIRFLMPS